MADKTIVVNADQAAREELVAELAEMAKNPPDEAKVEGGVFGNAGGKGFHNAHGQPVTAEGKLIKGGEAEEEEVEDEGDEPKSAARKSTRKR